MNAVSCFSSLCFQLSVLFFFCSNDPRSAETSPGGSPRRLSDPNNRTQQLRLSKRQEVDQKEGVKQQEGEGEVPTIFLQKEGKFGRNK